ncbi:Peptide transporter PTR1 [Tripterygium wilfordii]|uniref:Peptide transporter PTR1 n=1 Tax=Tripterygium wilfordii TaxID=458696 RepID=A0A7J7D0X7_TRIWF|nr:Peptide transporter PTR1 [Tripterygium wilfordii]
MVSRESIPSFCFSCRLTNKQKGGFRASMFIFALTALENMGFVANMISLVLYFLGVMYFDIPTASNTLTNFMGATFLLSLVGGFISDTFLNRFHTVLLFGAIEILGLALVTIQARYKSLHPEYCGGKPSCVEGRIAVMLYASLTLLALGSGGVRGALVALGADQFDKKDPKEAKDLATFFNWLTLSTVMGAAVGVTGIAWVSTKKAWYWGFFTSTVAAFVGFVVLAFGKPFFRLHAPGDSPILRVIEGAIKNRKLPLPDKPEVLYENNDKESTEEKIGHTNQFRFLDKAAIVTQGSEAAICTVTQVEEVKILTRMLPILGSTIIMNTCLAQLQTFSVQQGSIMDLHLGSLKVPAASIPVIPLVFMCILLPAYEFLFVPFARKITHHPSGITQLQRVGVGLVLSAISMAVAGIVEVKRRDQDKKDIGNPISLFWLSFQYGIFGIADMFSLVGLLEFFYKEAPAYMRSLSTSFTFLSLSFGYFLSSVFVDLINAITKRVAPSKKGWVEGSKLNENNLNLFYWFLAILSCLNFINYLYWASWYKYKAEEDHPEPNYYYKATDAPSSLANTSEAPAPTPSSQNQNQNDIDGEKATEENKAADET